MKQLLIIFFIITFGLLSRSGFAQAIHSSSNKAVKAYNEGVSLYDYFDYKNAETNFKIAISSRQKILRSVYDAWRINVKANAS